MHHGDTWTRLERTVDLDLIGAKEDRKKHDIVYSTTWRGWPAYAAHPDVHARPYRPHLQRSPIHVQRAASLLTLGCRCKRASAARRDHNDNVPGAVMRCPCPTPRRPAKAQPSSRQPSTRHSAAVNFAAPYARVSNALPSVHNVQRRSLDRSCERASAFRRDRITTYLVQQCAAPALRPSHSPTHHIDSQAHVAERRRTSPHSTSDRPPCSRTSTTFRASSFLSSSRPYECSSENHDERSSVNLSSSRERRAASPGSRCLCGSCQLGRASMGPGCCRLTPLHVDSLSISRGRVRSTNGGIVLDPVAALELWVALSLRPSDDETRSTDSRWSLRGPSSSVRLGPKSDSVVAKRGATAGDEWRRSEG